MASVAVPPGGGRYVYSGEGSGLGVWDMQDKAQPVLAGNLPLTGSDVTDIQFSSSELIAYLANGDGLQVVTLADPVKPTLLGSLAMSGNEKSVAVVEPAGPGPTYVLVGTGQSGPNGRGRVVDVSDPANLIEVGGYDTTGHEVIYEVTFDEANGHLPSTKNDPDHFDFRYEAQVNHAALDGQSGDTSRLLG